MTGSDEAVIEAHGLVKRYGSDPAGPAAVAGLDVVVRRGELFGFLGPNGAGKSSTMRMIACVSPRSGGDLRVLGLDPDVDGRRIRARLGVVPQEDTLDIELNVADNLYVYGRFFDLPRRQLRQRIPDILASVGLAERAGDRVDALSGGMKRRLTIARAMVSEPELVLLDEPTTGLDPHARHLLWDRLRSLKDQGVTQVLTTHYMDEAEQLCDRLVVVDDGRIVAEGSPADLIARHVSREVVELRFGDGGPVPGAGATNEAVLARLAGIGSGTQASGDRVLIAADDGDAAVAEVMARGLHPRQVLVRRATLEDVFLKLTGHGLGD
jgi:lipooligosaccharide transport system ATP-binding protein